MTNAQFTPEQADVIMEYQRQLGEEHDLIEKELRAWHKEHFKKSGTFDKLSGMYLTRQSQIDIAKTFYRLGKQKGRL